jgi:hypothetical protein
MPFVNIENSGKGNNKGSCKALVNYLCKENEGKSLTQREHFFSHSEDQINRLQVIGSIDNNISKLGSNDSKFFMVTLNFSKIELEHIKNDSTKIKQYARQVMDIYAKNFNKGLRSADLVWFAKIEYQRSYKGFEPEVLNGLAKQGELKPGLNTHVHFIISRKNKSQKLKLSPMTNHRQSSNGIIKSGFDRKGFKIECEKCFDRGFTYKRLPSDHFIVANMLKNGSREQRIKVRETIYKNQNPLVATLSLLEKGVSHYPLSEEEMKEKRMNRDQDQSYNY